MKIGITQKTSNCQAAGLFERAIELGVSGVEPMIVSAECDYLAWSEADIKSFLTRKRKLNISVPSVAMSLFTDNDALINPDKKDEAIELIAKSLAFTKGIEAPLMMLCNFFLSCPDTPEKLAQTVTILREAATMARELNIKLGLESPLPADELLAMIDAVNADNVGVYYDVGNSVGLGFDPETEIKQLGRNIVGMHIKDTEVVLGDSHLGCGRVDLGACLDAMRASGYDGWLMLETRPDDGNAVKRDIAMLKKMI